MKILLVQPALAYDEGADNLGVVRRVVEPFVARLEPNDVVLLPEHFDLRSSRELYEAGLRELATAVGCHVVGGSHHEDRDGERVNSGIVVDGSGSVVGKYEKLRPYADERSRVHAGTGFGEFSIGGRAVLVLICADFWFSDVFTQATRLPDVILVPALSVSRKPTPSYSKALWQHLAIARAYEFGVYVGISDWAHVGSPHGLSPSGVGGLADPTTTDPGLFFRSIAGQATLYDLDFGALDAFRRDRMARGFFWKKPDRDG